MSIVVVNISIDPGQIDSRRNGPRIEVTGAHLHLPGHRESDVLVLFKEEQDCLLRIKHFKPIHLQE